MRKILTILIVGFFVFSGFGKTLAQTPSKEATPSSAQEQKEIENLKEKLASKVAELRKKDQKAVSGNITETTKTGFAMKSLDDTIYEIKADTDLTKIYLIQGALKKEIKLPNLKKGDYVIVTGLIDGKTINANFVYQDEQFLAVTGRITEVNKTDFFLRVISPEKDTYTVDIENSTKRNLLDIKRFVEEPISFSKIKEGDTIHFIAKKTGTEREKNRYSAQKILIIPQEYFMK